MHEYIIDHQGTTLRYFDLNPDSDKTIIFIHGLGCASSFEYPQVCNAPILASYRKILVDMIGFGYSDKPQDFDYSIDHHAEYLIRFIHSLNLNNVVIYGHSMGGSIALSMTESLKPLLKGVIISEGNLDVGGGLGSKSIYDIGQEQYLSGGHTELIKNIQEQGNSTWTATASICSPKALYQGASSLVLGSSVNWREALYAIKQRAVYLFGEYSLPDEDQTILSKNGVCIDIIPNAGHSMALDNPSGLAQAIHNSWVHLAKSTDYQ